MFKYMKIISCVSIIIVFGMHNTKFMVKSVDKSSLEKDLRGAHFKVYGFQVCIIQKPLTKFY